MFYAWRRGYDISAGLLLGLATSYKVTPALFFVYFAYKRSWRTVGWGLLGLGIFLLIVPSAVIGPEFNGECLRHVVAPHGDALRRQGSDQLRRKSTSRSSGVLMRLLTYVSPGHGRYDTHLDLHLMSLPPWMVNYLIKGVALSLLGLLAFLCRTKTTDRSDPRLLGEVALVVLTMLFVSERSWKHHYVTVLMPYSYLVCEFFSSRVGPRSRMLLVGSWAVVICLDGGHVDGSGWFVRRGAGTRDRSGLWLVSVGGSCALYDGRLACLGAPLRNAGLGHARRALARPIPRSHLNTASQPRPVVTS